MRGLRLPFSSIKGQIFIVFAVTFLSIIGLTLLNYWSLSTVKARLLLGEQYDDLLNNILEVRRFEKNFLFYNDDESLREGAAYLKQIDELVSKLSDDIIQVTDQRTFETFLGTLRDYERTMRAYESQGGKAPKDSEEIRQWGKTLVDFAARFLTTKRDRIHKAIVRTSVVPFAFLGIFLLLMLLVIKLISQGLLRPLSVLQATTQRVAKGDYSPTSYEGLYTDEISDLITAFNRMAEELEANQEHLLQARKIAALGTFTAGIAHELNNPINNICLTAETYVEEYSGLMNAEAKELMRDIHTQAERAGDIVRNLLNFSRTERPAFSSLEVKEIVRSTVALVKNQIMLAGIKLDLELREGLPQVRGNLRNLQQVFMNLLLNSIQAMPDGGAISFGAKIGPPGFVRFDLRDTGSGITPEVLEHIFEPFYTTKNVGRGTGLGLAVTYALVKRHGGRIEVKSEAGSGTAFSVLLPIARADNEAADPIPEKRDHAGANSHRG
jgi:signal transduction histidine kinase